MSVGVLSVVLLFVGVSGMCAGDWNTGVFLFWLGAAGFVIAAIIGLFTLFDPQR